MKKFPIIFYFITLLMSTQCNTQIINEQELRYYADQLAVKKILTAEGAEMLVKKINAKEVDVGYSSTVKAYFYTSTDPAKESILQFCSEAFATALLMRVKDFGKAEGYIKPKPTAITVSLTNFTGHRKPDKDYINRDRSASGMTLRRTLKDIRDIGLTDDKIHESCLKLIDGMSIDFEKDLLRAMSAEPDFHRLYAFHKQEQTEYIDKLAGIGLLHQTARKQLVDSYADSLLKTIPERRA